MKNALNIVGLGIAGAALLLGGTACSTFKSVLALEKKDQKYAPIHNPFYDYTAKPQEKPDNIVLRTKRGDRSVEVELPGATGDLSDFVIPMSPAFSARGANGRAPAAAGEGSDGAYADEANYRERKPGIADREITSGFSGGMVGNEGERREVENGLGVIAAEDEIPQGDSSYLAAMDHIKGLYKSSRYEAALLEIDEMLRQYPTDPKLYEMRGTLFDRIGRTELAIRSWNQALRLDPGNQSLRKFIDRKQQTRSLASPSGGKPK